MMLRPARARPTDRVQTQTDKRPVSQSFTVPAPVAGWFTNGNPADLPPNAAHVLDNFWPRASGIQPRGGTQLRVTVASRVYDILEYRAGALTVVTTETEIYTFDAETAGEAALTPDVTGQTSGRYCGVEMQTDGGSFLSLVNGVDYLQIYDGTSWQQVTDVSTPHAITGVDTSLLISGWVYQARAFFIEKESMNAWYLGVNSVSGAATKLPLAGVFSKGGNLLYGTTWSSDAGDGMSARCVFITDQGEVAVYQGIDPSSATTWSLVGVYDLGEPLGHKAHIRVGGDVLIGSEVGLIPLSAAVQKEVGELQLKAASYAIQPEWQKEAALSNNSREWITCLWPSRNMAIIAPPIVTEGRNLCFVVNVSTGAWARFTGWDISAMGISRNLLFWGDTEGNVFQADLGGTDNGTAFTCKAALASSFLGAPAAFKVVGAVRGTFTFFDGFTPQFSIGENYRIEFPTAPNATISTNEEEAEWDAAEWDNSFWAADGNLPDIYTKWQSVSGLGHAIALQLQITSGAAYKLDCEFVAADVTYTAGAVIA